LPGGNQNIPKLANRLIILSDDAFLSISGYENHPLQIHGLATSKYSLFALLTAEKARVDNFAEKYLQMSPGRQKSVLEGQLIRAQLFRRFVTSGNTLDWYTEMVEIPIHGFLPATAPLPDTTTSVDLKELEAKITLQGNLCPERDFI